MCMYVCVHDIFITELTLYTILLCALHDAVFAFRLLYQAFKSRWYRYKNVDQVNNNSRAITALCEWNYVNFQMDFFMLYC